MEAIAVIGVVVAFAIIAIVVDKYRAYKREVARVEKHDKEIEQARKAYWNGEIDFAELDRREADINRPLGQSDD